MKKSKKIELLLLIVLVILGIIFYTVDKTRANEDKKPLFCIKIGAFLDGGTVEYIGLGYKVIAFNKLGDIRKNEKPYTKVHIGSWFMTYESAYEHRNK